MAWTDEMIATLKTLWDQGISTGEIGKRLGVTKNSVVGKVHRLGLDGRPSPIKRKGETKPVAKKEDKPIKESKKTKKEAVEPKALPKIEKIAPPKTKKIEHFAPEPKLVPIKKEKEAEVAYKEGGSSLTELGLNSCRWPIGDPKDDNFHFCGKKARVGQTYCDEHSQIAYVKIVKK